MRYIKRSRRALLFKALLFIIVGTALPGIAQAQKPDWVERQPVSKEHYIGIAMATKKSTGNEHVRIARDKALKNIASEIMIDIKGEHVQTMVEQSGMVQQEVLSQIRSSTKASLEGYELVRKWEDSESYWVYYRLSKALYLSNKQKKYDRATSAAVDFYTKARQSDQAGQAATALNLYIKALTQLDAYLMEPIEVELDGESVYLANEIYASMQAIVNRMSLKPLNANLRGKTGLPLSEPLTLQVSVQGSEKPGRFPMSFTFKRGSGELLSTMKTDNMGKAYNKVKKITAMDKLQVVEASLNMDKLLPMSGSALLKNMILNLQPPTARFVLSVSGMAVYLDVVETHFINPGKVLYVEPKLKNLLSQKGFSFVGDAGKADLSITCQAKSRKGMSLHGMNSAYVDLSLAVIDLKTGEEIYKNAISDIKGLHLDYNQASVKAFENASGELVTLIPQMIRNIQK
jgi:hypothetical protein